MATTAYLPEIEPRPPLSASRWEVGEIHDPVLGGCGGFLAFQLGQFPSHRLRPVGTVLRVKYLAFASSDGPMIARVETDGSNSVSPLALVDQFYEDPHHWLNLAGDAPMPRDQITEVPAVPVTSRVLCLGQNYMDHINEIAEIGREAPAFPNVFGRWASTLTVDNGEVSVPPGDIGLDWEAELAVVIGQHMGPTSEADAMNGVLAYSCFNDISARKIQKSTSQWTLGKNVDNSGPIGPEFVTADELGDPNNLAIACRVNGETMQSANTELMLFKIPRAIAWITAAMSLRPGDVIAMGTPAGVGLGMDPPRFMNAGDQVEVEIENIGVLRTRVV